VTEKTVKPAPPDGVLIIDKPTGMTSHDVVSRLRRILKTKKIGHTGTLDPFATGVLVMVVGKATRIARFLDQDKKSYSALVRFGFETDTGDREGTAKEQVADVGDRNGKTPDTEEVPDQKELARRVEAVLPEFTGDILQVPPMYSAKKIKGKKLYEFAREGIEIDREPVALHIHKIAVEIASQLFEKTADTVVLHVTSSAGTYIRTLAEDIGRKIGIGCHLAELRRVRAGRFSIDQAVTLEELETLAENHLVPGRIVPMNDAVDHLPMMKLTPEELKMISNGIAVEARIEAGPDMEIRLTDMANELVAVGQFKEDNTIQPRIVFNSV
jgi:tRNA pseudouridine55 synthase